MPGKQSYYETLGVDRKASADNIKRAYRRLAKKYHPDRNADDASAESKFKQVQQAYDVLGDKDRRAEYDRYGDVGVGQVHTNPGGQRVYQWGGDSAVNVDDLEDLMAAFGGGHRASVFEELFGGRQGSRRQPARRGADETREVTLTFDQAVRGATVTTRLRSGRGSTWETLDVKIPPGVQEGQRIRITGKGLPGTSNGPPGDLYLVCKIQPHPYFRRSGSNVMVNVPISTTEAVLGATVTVPTLDGSAEVQIPPGTNSGAKLRLKGCGVAGRGKQDRGDQFVIIDIVAPADISDESRELYVRLHSQESFNPRKDCDWSNDI